MHRFLLTISLISLMTWFMPVWCEGPPARLMQTGMHHGEEVSAKTGERWWGLFRQEGPEDGYFIKPVTVTVDAVFDPMMDASPDGPVTGKEVWIADDVPDDQTLLYLVQNVPGVAEGPVATVFDDADFVAPGRTLHFDLGDRYYRLNGYGQAHDDGKITGYKLKVTGAEEQSQIIHTADELYWGEQSDNLPKLLWAGDLNHDGQLDLILDRTHHYNLSNPTLYLSPGNAEHPLLVPVAEFQMTGC